MTPGSGETNVLLLGGVALVGLLILRGWFNRRPGSNRPAGESAEPSAGYVNGLAIQNRDTALRDAPTETLRWQVEMHETARELKGELDSKLSALQALVVMARQEYERLFDILERAEKLGFANQDSRILMESLANGTRGDLSDLPTVSAAAQGSLEIDNARQWEIFTRYDAGETPRHISLLMGVPLADVELALSLRPR